MEYKLERIKGSGFSVVGLPNDYDDSGNYLLMVRYETGDCDLVYDNGQAMHEALYDLYQTHETLRDGDVFTLNGTIVYRCQGVHVYLVDEA